jgi:hypothetical protein
MLIFMKKHNMNEDDMKLAVQRKEVTTCTIDDIVYCSIPSIESWQGAGKKDNTRLFGAPKALSLKAAEEASNVFSNISYQLENKSQEASSKDVDIFTSILKGRKNEPARDRNVLCLEDVNMSSGSSSSSHSASGIDFEIAKEARDCFEKLRRDYAKALDNVKSGEPLWGVMNLGVYYVAFLFDGVFTLLGND